MRGGLAEFGESMKNDITHQGDVPAVGVHWLTPYYDPALAFLTREHAWRPRLVDQVAPKPGERILDLGCGTGTLSLMLRQRSPETEVIGLDPDTEALRNARAKADAAGITIRFWQGRADDPSNVPMFRQDSFDKIVSCLLFHHLTTEQKHRAFARARVLLRPGGEIHIADWGAPANGLMRLLFYSVQTLDGFANTADNIRGLLPNFMRDAGFVEIAETHRQSTALGTLSFYRGTK